MHFKFHRAKEPYKVSKNCKTVKEAMAASGYHIEQPAKVARLLVTGNETQGGVGSWCVLPEFEADDGPTSADKT